MNHKQLRTKLAMIKEKGEMLICHMLDSNTDMVEQLKELRGKNTSKTIRMCIDIVIAELTYVKYSRVLDSIDENTKGEIDENFSNW